MSLNQKVFDKFPTNKLFTKDTVKIIKENVTRTDVHPRFTLEIQVQV